jgi:transcriptional regulator with XRE-family HTH domain
VEKELPRIFGKVLKGVREERKLSQQALADYADMDRAYISKLERGISVPSIITIFKLATILEVKPSDFILKVDRQLSK